VSELAYRKMKLIFLADRNTIREAGNTVRFVPEADIFFEPELAKFCQYQNR